MVPEDALRRPGWANLAVSPIALGMSRIGSFSNANGAPEARRLLAKALDAGVNVFDTADIYGQGQSEHLLGEAVRRNRAEVVVCTKVGYKPSGTAKLVSKLKPLIKPLVSLATKSSTKARSDLAAVRGAQIGQDFSAVYIEAATEASLRRLGCDYVDLLMLHSPPTDLPWEEVIACLQRMQSGGKIRGYGVSCRAPADAYAFLSWPGIAAVQLRLPPVEARADLFNAASTAGVGVIVREVLIGIAPEDEAARRAALRDPLESPVVNFVVVGTQNPAHLTENLAVAAQ